MKNIKIKLIFSLVILLFSFALVGFTQAKVFDNLVIDINSQVSTAAPTAGGNTTAVTPQIFIARIIQIVLSTVGIVFVALVFYGSYNLVTARGEEEKIKKALEVIRPAIVGLMIIIVSYSITAFFVSRFQTATQSDKYNDARTLTVTTSNSGVRVD